MTKELTWQSKQLKYTAAHRVGLWDCGPSWGGVGNGMDRAHGFPLVVKLKKGHNLLDNRPDLNIGFIFVFRSTVVHTHSIVLLTKHTFSSQWFPCFPDLYENWTDRKFNNYILVIRIQFQTVWVATKPYYDFTNKKWWHHYYFVEVVVEYPKRRITIL